MDDARKAGLCQCCAGGGRRWRETGRYHVLDARRLAEKYGRDPNVWFGNVDYFMLNKSKPQYYKDSVCRNGYARGAETCNFVEDVVERYEHYQALIQ